MTRSFLPPRPARALLLAALCLGAAACSHDEGAQSLESSIAAPGGRTRTDVLALAPADHPARRQPIAALPPEAGAVRDVRVHSYVDGLRQDVALSGGAFAPVRNGVTVLARTSAEPTLDERVPLARPTEAGIRSEIGTQFPHLAMQVVERSSGNGYGPYGLALGRAGGDVRCLYAWQWIDANRMPAQAGVAGPLSLRVRLCQAGTSFDAMAALVDHLAIGAEPDVQVAALGPDTVVAAPDARPASRPTRRRARAHAHRRPLRLVRREDAAPLAPVEAAPTEPRTMAAASQASAAPVAATPPPTVFAADLPPQALLGPKAGAKTKAGPGANRPAADVADRSY